jgi:hypothetical protein
MGTAAFTEGTIGAGLFVGGATGAGGSTGAAILTGGTTGSELRAGGDTSSGLFTGGVAGTGLGGGVTTATGDSTNGSIVKGLTHFGHFACLLTLVSLTLNFDLQFGHCVFIGQALYFLPFPC